MSPEQQKQLQELSRVFSEGNANPTQIQQLSDLLGQINRVHDQSPNNEPSIIDPRLKE